jgi:hypothetical protein
MTSLPDFDSDPEEYAKATGRVMAEAMLRFHEIAAADSDNLNISYEEALDRYDDMIKAVKDCAKLEQRFMLRIALGLARKLDELNLIPKDRIAHKVCYVDLREYLDVEGGNRDSYVTPRWLANALPAEYRKK